MKSEIYNALAALNRGFDLALESLTICREKGVLPADYVEEQTVMAEELKAGVNHRLHDKLGTAELGDWTQFGKMRITIEERRRNETTTPTTTGDSGQDASGENGQRAKDGPESA